VPLITITEAAKSFDVSRSTLYEKVKAGELSRNSDKLIDTADLLRLFGEPGQSKRAYSNGAQQNTTNALASEFLDVIKSKDEDIATLRAQLDDTKNRLNEQREAARALVSPEKMEERETEWKKELTDQRKQTEKARAQTEEAKANALAEADRAEKTKEETAEAWKKRSFIDRVLNREPALETAK